MIDGTTHILTVCLRYFSFNIHVYDVYAQNSTDNVHSTNAYKDIMKNTHPLYKIPPTKKNRQIFLPERVDVCASANNM